ncbi:MAG: hypothetical protein A3E85_04240 [Gammaproteobacteria bacterium RIFCSPHIGHO2_12_FULL_45_12]|nr:MAG: hypothetical protein A3E85_04240 [Gammaproteobacteria bacterium RIFCSPHIGHO2_12_FULL_45_12]
MNLREFFNLTYYTSKLDTFLKQFDREHPALSASQRREKEKYDRLYTLRDQATHQPKPETHLWENFQDN